MENILFKMAFFIGTVLPCLMIILYLEKLKVKSKDPKEGYSEKDKKLARWVLILLQMAFVVVGAMWLFKILTEF